jgi:hypothetical protein
MPLAPARLRPRRAFLVWGQCSGEDHTQPMDGFYAHVGQLSRDSGYFGAACRTSRSSADQSVSVRQRPSSWIAVLDKISALRVRYVLPDHRAPGDGSLVSKERNLIDDLRTRALALKQQGVSADDAGKQLSAEFKTKYSDWPNMNVAGFVRSIYAE